MPSLPLLARRLIDVSSFSLIRINSLLCCLRYIFSPIIYAPRCIFPSEFMNKRNRTQEVEILNSKLIIIRFNYFYVSRKSHANSINTSFE